MATDKQANHYQMQVHQLEWKPPQTQYTYDKFKHTNTIPTVLCTSNGLICGYITSAIDKRSITSHVT